MRYAWVLWHRYYDGSAATIMRVYLDETRAKEDFALFQADAPTYNGEVVLDKVAIYAGEMK